MKQSIQTASLVLVSLLMVASCCEQNEPNPNLYPSQTRQEHITKACHSWLNARMMDEDWAIFNRPDAEWRYASTVAAISSWFDNYLEPPELWDFDLFIQQMTQSELFHGWPPSDHEFEFVSMIRNAFLSFEYFPEQEE